MAGAKPHLLTPLTILLLSFLFTWAPIYASPQGEVRVLAGNRVETYSRLEAAVREAPPFSTILVGPGTYQVHLVIDKPLTLRGEGWPTLDGGGIGTVITIRNTSSVRVEGFRVVNSGVFYSTEDAGIKVVGSRQVVIAGNRLERVFYAIMLKDSTGVLISGNNITSIPEFYLSDRGHGVYSWYSWGVVVEDNQFSYVADGTFCDHSYNMTVSGNRVGDARYGVHLMYCEDVTIRGNSVTRSVAGVVPMYSKRVLVVGNRVVDNRIGGIGEGIFLLEDDDIVVVDNVVAGNMVGLYIGRTPYTPGAEAEVRRNLVAFNLVGVSIDTISSPLIYENSFVENLEDVRLTGLGDSRALWYNPATRRGNFWSSHRGEGAMVAQNLLEDLLDSHREVRVLTYSPAFLMLEVMKRGVPDEARVKVVDQYPLKAPPLRVEELLAKRPWGPEGLAYPGLLVLVGLTVLRYARRWAG